MGSLGWTGAGRKSRQRQPPAVRLVLGWGLREQFWLLDKAGVKGRREARGPTSRVGGAGLARGKPKGVGLAEGRDQEGFQRQASHDSRRSIYLDALWAGARRPHYVLT